MKKIITSVALFSACVALQAQSKLPSKVDPDWSAKEVIFPESPFKFQVLFVGNSDFVQVAVNDSVVAKQDHDFIGYTAVTPQDNVPKNAIAWLSINHESRLRNDKIGDGGGMTVFLIGRDPKTDEIKVLPQTLEDGRKGKFFNMDFSEVGYTHTNCGGITSWVDGRIWTSEEYFRSRQSVEAFFSDMSDFTIQNSGIEMADGKTLTREANFNWMVEVDPRKAKAIRKQYNWGRQSFEGGAMAMDNKTVYLGEDGTPAHFSKFVADTPGDFTKGKLYVYNEQAPDKWSEIDNSSLDNPDYFWDNADVTGYTIFNRIEWSVIDQTTGKVYFTETGRDNPGGGLGQGVAWGGHIASHHIARAQEQGVAVTSDQYNDYFGRIMEYDPATNEMKVYLEGGPYFEKSPSMADYPKNHLSNPDAMSILYTQGKRYLIICEDLNGGSHGRVPAGAPYKACEIYLLDMDIANPTVDDLIRIAQMPAGAEATGCVASPDGKTIFANVQHPSGSNPFPYNKAMTFAITGFDNLDAIESLKVTQVESVKEGEFGVYPNPVQRILNFSKNADAALYDATGKRVKVVRNANTLDVSDLAKGVYFLKTQEGEQKKIIVQ